MKYDFGYKYFQLNVDKVKVTIQLSFNNMLGAGTFCAKTDYMFQDEYGDWGHAAGVGKNEKQALSMCINEIQEYTNHHIDMNSLVEINLPKRITFIYKKRTVILNFEQIDNSFSIFTPNGRKNIITDDIVEYVSNNPKEFIKDSVENYSEQLFKKYNFNKTFDAMTCKYIR